MKRVNILQKLLFFEYKWSIFQGPRFLFLKNISEGKFIPVGTLILESRVLNLLYKLARQRFHVNLIVAYSIIEGADFLTVDRHLATYSYLY